MFHYSSSLALLYRFVRTRFFTLVFRRRSSVLRAGRPGVGNCLPKTPVPLQPHFKLLKRLGPQRINPPLRVNANVNQSGVTKHSQMLGHLRLAKVQAVDMSPTGRGRQAAVRDLKAVGSAKARSVSIMANANMPQNVYSCQGIFYERNIKVPVFHG